LHKTFHEIMHHNLTKKSLKFQSFNDYEFSKNCTGIKDLIMARANLKKVNNSQLLLPQHQSTYPRGPESIEIPLSDPNLLSKCTYKCEHCETRFP